MSTLVKDWHSAGQYGDMVEGISELNDGILQTLRIPLDAASEIIGAHFKIMTPFLLRPDSSYPPGPNVVGIRKYTGWTHLHDLDTEGFITFYFQLVVDCLSFYIALTPFHGVDLRYGHDGLCLPGLGNGYSLTMLKPFGRSCRVWSHRRFQRWRHRSTSLLLTAMATNDFGRLARCASRFSGASAHFLTLFGVHQTMYSLLLQQ
jgi:hypothetical protein